MRGRTLALLGGHWLELAPLDRLEALALCRELASETMSHVLDHGQHPHTATTARLAAMDPWEDPRRQEYYREIGRLKRAWAVRQQAKLS